MTAEDLPRLVAGRLRQWEHHPEYKDMLAEAYYLAWRAYVRAEAQGARSPLAVGIFFSRYGPNEWLARWLGEPR
jgi:hypothetical protein